MVVSDSLIKIMTSFIFIETMHGGHFVLWNSGIVILMCDVDVNVFDQLTSLTVDCTNHS